MAAWVGRYVWATFGWQWDMEEQGDEEIMSKRWDGHVATSGLRMASIVTVDSLLSTCPTEVEVADIERAVPLSFDVDPGPFQCPHGGDLPVGARWGIVSALRVMKFMTFRSPIPVIGESNLFKWFTKNRLGVRVFSSGEFSNAGNPINIRIDTTTGPWLRFWTNDVGLGLSTLVALLVHEAAHTILDKGHDCSSSGWWQPESRNILVSPSGKEMSLSQANDAVRLGKEPDFGNWSNDSSLAYGGAWAAQYWFYRSCASYGQLSESERAVAGKLASDLRASPQLNCGHGRPAPAILGSVDERFERPRLTVAFRR